MLACLSQVVGQYTIGGTVIDQSTGQPIVNTEVYNLQQDQLTYTDKNGYYQFTDLEAGTYDITIFTFDYSSQTLVVSLEEDTTLNFELTPLAQQLSAVEITARKEEFFALRRLRAVEGTRIYAGKKSEVILMDNPVAAVASNTARQIYAQVLGLNIYEGNDAGLQLSIGGRGLDPNRTANFNTRQNGYDISADVLGYPESYYTPPAEALSEIQVIRGAASLQYGTQFGGLINFKMRRPDRQHKISLVSRQTVGSFGLRTSFNSISGTIGKWSYYTYFNYKKGDGYRNNSDFDSKNVYFFSNYDFTERTSISVEATYLKYLAKQAGGLTDSQFDSNPRLSTRDRNWFEVDWRLFSAKFNHKFSSRSELDVMVFGLDAQRNSLGFRGDPISLNSNPITDLDEQDADGNYLMPRDLIKGTFDNYGVESRFLSQYKLGRRDAVFLVGLKIYKAENTSLQTAGSNGSDADFSVATDRFPSYPNQSNFLFPNFNVAAFGEQIFYLSDKISITPGVRYEYIKTESNGDYRQINFDIAGNPISNVTLDDNRTLERGFILLGVGGSYRPRPAVELYANISQNYRSVTFSDIRVASPTFIIDPDISDEKGYTADLGLRGKVKEDLSFDVGIFGLRYDNRIGIVLDDRANRIRKNIGTAFIYGLETFADWNIGNPLGLDPKTKSLSVFINTALTGSEYIASEEANVVGNDVEFIPRLNLKTGIKVGISDLRASLQYTHLTDQWTDAENSPVPPSSDIRSGVIGTIPGYSVLDFSLTYRFRWLDVETGVLNLADSNYYTRRATGYPGPGIIPSEGRSVYLTIGIRLDR